MNDQEFPEEMIRSPISQASYFAAEYDVEADELLLLDQRELPGNVYYHRYRSSEQVARAIQSMVVRGAPAIGIAAAYAIVLDAKRQHLSEQDFRKQHQEAVTDLLRTRPTAVNLSWALERMSRCASSVAQLPPAQRATALLNEAQSIHREDLQACQRLGAYGAEYVPHAATVLTYCNAGALATGGFGTALGVIRAAFQQGNPLKVLACETRPYLQGARLTAWELQQDQIPVEVITDSMVGHLMQRGEIDFVVVGSDRIAANGDVANKIGTYGVAVLAQVHDIPFTVAAPWSTVDLSAASGGDIPIEERSSEEVAKIGGKLLVPDGVRCRHPAFDVTPARYVHAIFTERGVVHPAKGQTPSTLV